MISLIKKSLKNYVNMELALDRHDDGPEFARVMPIQFNFHVDVIVNLFCIKYIISFRYVLICDHSSKLLMKYIVVAREIFPYFYVGFVISSSSFLCTFVSHLV